MTIDISRKSFDHRKNYSGLICEQGRVQLDSDWNEASAIADRRMRAETLDMVGRCRVPPETPDAFRIGIVGGDLTIGPGRMYVDGFLAENHGGPPEEFDPVLAELAGTSDLPFDQQPFLIETDTNDLADGRYLVYLDVWPRDVTYIEDPELVEKAVGIPTTARQQTVWQVKILDEELGPDVICSATDEDMPGWQEVVRSSGGRLSTQTGEIPGNEDPCLLPHSGGYRGLENRTYRVAIHNVDNDGNATFKWARHNATVVSAVTAIPSLNRLDVENIGRDPVLRFNDGDWIEILDDALELAAQPGIIRRIESVDDATHIITLTNPLPPGVFPTVDGEGNLDPTRHTRVRRWDQSGEIRDIDGNLVVDLDAQNSEGVIPVPTPGTSIRLEDGILVTLDLATPEGRYKKDDYWVFTARAVDASMEVLNQQPPCGIHHHYCRLAIVEVANNEFVAVVEDCRDLVPEASDTSLGCCSVMVAPGESIQTAIDNLPAQGGRICLSTGEYLENIRIANRRNIVVTGCGRRSRLVSQSPADDVSDASPVIHIENSLGISIDSLAVEAHTTGIGILVDGQPADPDEPSRLVVQNIELSGLYVQAAFGSGIEFRTGNELLVRDCRITMRDVPGDWPGIFLVGEDALVERNVITVESADVSASGRILPINAGRGGLQIGGTSERVRVRDNLIQRGVGDGITLGSLEEVDETNNIINGLIAWPIGVEDPCDLCSTPPTRIPPRFRIEDDDEEPPIYRSAGSLSDIVIRYNRIYDMGRNGIGVAGFFDLSELDEFISIHWLTINDNEIRGCLNKPLVEVDETMIDYMGYGGIALADVTDLVIQNNIIEDNGRDHFEPVCGVFVLHCEGGDITDNRILNNGAKTTGDIENVKRGRRGGINIVYAVTPTVNIGPQSNLSIGPKFPRQNGVPAAKIHDNVVSQPLGRALSLAALGPVSVVNNQLTSRGVLEFIEPLAPSSIAATVLISNLGVSNELYGQILGFSSFAGGEVLTNTPGAADIEDESVTLIQGGLDDFRAGRYLANGNVLFADNQCVLDLLDQEVGRALSSVAIMSLDDIGVHSNQCDCSLSTDFLLFPNYFLSPSLRVSDNRFKEGFSNALVSAVTFGLMNTTTGNQATHCLIVVGPPLLKVESDNKVLLNAIPLLLEQQFCERIKEIIDNLTGLGNWL
jgi:hypothetical protein